MEKLRLVPIGLLIAFVGKIGYLGASLPDAFVVFTLALLAGYLEHMPTKNELTAIKKELDDNKKDLSDLKKNYEDLKTHVVGLKIGTQMQKVNMR